MRERFLRQAKREYRPGQRLALLAVAAVFFVLLLPYLLMVLGPRLDGVLGLPRLALGTIGLALGVGMILGGWLLAVWTIYVQFTLGRGTPVPVMATQELVVEPPFTYCRNPMALGAIILYLGVAVVIGSLSAAGLVLLGAALLLWYIHRFEEWEMEQRFGQAYLDYRRRTPFLIPRFRRLGRQPGR